MSISSSADSGVGNENSGDGLRYELPLLLLAGYRVVIDEAHKELAECGHPDLRPAHGFALQAIGTFGATAADVGRRLGVSKQAAGKTIDRLTELGYVTRATEAADRRRKLVRLTPRGWQALAQSAESFARVRARWAAELGADRVAALEADLQTMTAGQPFRLDLPGWLGG